MTVVNGPNAKPELQLGFCGLFCRASSADTQGVTEYDIRSNKVVGRHMPPQGTVGMQPFATPSGDLLFFGLGDGKSVQVLKPAVFGSQSTLVGTINLGHEIPAGNHGTSDLTVVTTGSKRIAIFTSTMSNDIALVDLDVFERASDSNIISVDATLVALHNEAETSSQHDVRAVNVRRVRWATGTNYVWVDSTLTDKIHIVKVSPTSLADIKVVRTLENLDSLEFIFVRSYLEERIIAMIGETQTENVIQNISTQDASKDSTPASPQELPFLEEIEDSVNSSKTKSIVAIILSTVAAVAASFSIWMGVHGRKNSDKAFDTGAVSRNPDGSISTVPPEQESSASETHSNQQHPTAFNC